MKEIKKVKAAAPPYPYEAYARVVTPLPEEDGGGYLLTIPDLPGCMADGETMEEAMENGRDAFIGWISAQIDMGRDVPAPQWQAEAVPHDVSGKFIQRVPRTVHAKLVRRAKAEGVSLNSLVLTFIAEGLGRRERKGPKTASKHAQ
jgi:antitoxin HicB